MRFIGLYWIVATVAYVVSVVGLNGIWLREIGSPNFLWLNVTFVQLGLGTLSYYLFYRMAHGGELYCPKCNSGKFEVRRFESIRPGNIICRFRVRQCFRCKVIERNRIGDLEESVS
jgi:hypothetical protein